MGILLKLLFSESKDQLNIVVEDYDKVTKEVQRTMLDVVVNLESKQNNVSDIDDCSNDDLITNPWNTANNELEKVLGEELGIEISNITGNAVPFEVASSNDKSDSAFAAVISMAEKCTISDQDEEEILNADFTKIDVAKNVISPDDPNLGETIESDQAMVVATVVDENTILSMTDTQENMDSETSQNILVITDVRSKNRDQSFLLRSSKNDDQSTPTCSTQKQQSNTTSEKSKELTTPSTSQTSSRKHVRENSQSPKKSVPARSESREERRRNQSEDDDCEFIIEEVLDLDTLEEIDRWSVGDGSDSRILVDLTDRENIDPRVRSCYGWDQVITVDDDDFSDDDDEVCSQYSSARSTYRRRTGSDEGPRAFDRNFVPLRRAMSDPPQEETLHDDEDYENEIQVLDSTFDKVVECVDLTSDRKCGSAPILPDHRIIRRSTSEVMNDLRNFYSSNKDIIATRKDALRTFAHKTDKKKSGIEAPPKLSNGLPYRKRCSPVIHESDIKFSRTTRSSGADDSRQEITPFNKNVPKPTRGPPGFRLNDDFGKADSVTPKEEECAPPDRRYSDSTPNFGGRPSRRFNLHGNRRDGRTPSTIRYNNHPRTIRYNNYPRMQGKRFFKRFSQNYVSPLRRHNCARKPSRSIQPTNFRGEVWLDRK